MTAMSKCRRLRNGFHGKGVACGCEQTRKKSRTKRYHGLKNVETIVRYFKDNENINPSSTSYPRITNQSNCSDSVFDLDRRFCRFAVQEVVKLILMMMFWLWFWLDVLGFWRRLHPPT